jgi:electron transfer flavoprotein beta subunit
MKIAVCLKEVIDTSVNLGYGQVDSTLMQKGLVYKLNPVDAQALAEALKLKVQDAGTEITLISIGAETVESQLREGLALGANKAIRIWEEGLRDITPYQTAKVLARALKPLNFDLILLGAKSLDNASGLVGPLIAAWLEIPCICEVVELQREKNNIITTRNVSKGIQEKIQSALPAVLAIAASREKLPYASLDQIMVSKEAPVTCLSLSDLGISPAELQEDPTQIVGISFPRPRPRTVPYDSSLPAFYRILALLQGGITKRRSQILQGDTEALVDQLFELLIKEEVIKTAPKR